MKYSPVHEKQKNKNFTLLAILLGLVVLFFAITVVKISGAAGS